MAKAVTLKEYGGARRNCETVVTIPIAHINKTIRNPAAAVEHGISMVSLIYTIPARGNNNEFWVYTY